MNKTFLLSGGAGRIITAIPALERYHEENPDDDFKVIIYGWSSLYHSHPILQSRTYDANQKGIFDLIIKDSILVSPEPYHLYDYYNQQCNLVEAFDELINGDRYMVKPNLYLHSNEDQTAFGMIQDAKKTYNKKKFIVYQPYGSGMSMVNGVPMDSSGRSLTINAANYIASKLSKDAVVLYFGSNEFIQPNTDFMLTTKDIPNADLRFFMAMIKNCDHFVGVDSVGQHMARSFQVDGDIIMGSTFENNVSYSEWFRFHRKEGKSPYYNPIRISFTDGELTDRLNDGIMDFSKEECDVIVDKILMSK